MPVSVEVDPAFGRISTTAADSILNHVIEQEGFSVDEISIVLGNDDLLSKLKKDFFNKDQFTDVIAFRLNEYKEKKVEGEIYISIPRARENAKKFSESFAKEIGRLIIHGGLHLVNYDDETEAEKNIMTLKEEKYLNQCNWQDLINE